jgi:hypothetical protein
MTAQHGVEGVYATAEHAARQYLPTSVVDKLEGVGVLRESSGIFFLLSPNSYKYWTPGSQETPVPSPDDREYNSAPSPPSQGSVGSLSGLKEPAGVAKVPEESKEEATEGGAYMDPKIGNVTHSLPRSHFIPIYQSVTSRPIHH